MEVSLSAAKSRILMFVFVMCVRDVSGPTHNCNWRAESIEQGGVEKERGKERRPNCRMQLFILNDWNILITYH